LDFGFWIFEQVENNNVITTERGCQFYVAFQMEGPHVRHTASPQVGEVARVHALSQRAAQRAMWRRQGRRQSCN